MAQSGSEKKALLIGIGKYPAVGGWASLSSANDLKLINEALIKQGFKPDNIKFLADEEATRQNIIDAIKKELISGVKKGDIAYLHFSGHGQQKADDDGDEIDGFDECLVPYDSPKKFIKGVNEGQFLITDDEFGGLLTDVRRQLGSSGHLIVSLDACHSGTATRGASIGRGSAEPMASPDYVLNNIQNKKQSELNKLSSGIINSSEISPMIAFFGSSQNQINYEMTNDQGEQFGSLSYALSKYLLGSKSGESYRGLFDKIKVEMSHIAPFQLPQVEGDLDLEVLNGKALGLPVYFNVVSILGEDEVLIDGGFLQDLSEGSKLGFYKTDTRSIESTHAIVTGIISKCNATTSIVLLDSIVKTETLKSSWVYVVEKNMGNLVVSLSIKVQNAEANQKIRSKLFSYSFIKEDDLNPSLFIKEDKSGNGESYITLKTDLDYVLDSFSIRTLSQGQLIRLSKKILDYLKGSALRKLSLQSEDCKLSFKIIPLKDRKVQYNDKGEIITLKENEAGIKQMKIGDLFQILIKNEGIRPAYFNLIDLQPDNKFKVILPAGDQTPEEMKILPGMEKLIPNVWEVYEPFGNELFKLVASTKAIDLRSTYGTRGSQSKNPFEKMIEDLGTEAFHKTRGSKPVPVGNVDINIYSETFIIVK